MSYTFQTIFHLVISSEFHVRSTVLTTDIVESSLDYKREEGREKKKKKKKLKPTLYNLFKMNNRGSIVSKINIPITFY